MKYLRDHIYPPQKQQLKHFVTYPKVTLLLISDAKSTKFKQNVITAPFYLEDRTK